MKNKVISIIIDALKELAADFENDNIENIADTDGETILYGMDGILESIELVSLIADLEEIIFDEFGRDITLADEKAMSQNNSPFRTVNSLSDYIESLLTGDAGDDR